jgi:hypothetical protein
MVDPTTHAITEFSIQNGDSGDSGSTGPFAIVAGADGTVWFTLSQSDQIGVINLNVSNSGSAGSTGGTGPINTSASAHHEVWAPLALGINPNQQASHARLQLG